MAEEDSACWREQVTALNSTVQELQGMLGKVVKDNLALVHRSGLKIDAAESIAASRIRSASPVISPRARETLWREMAKPVSEIGRYKSAGAALARPWREGRSQMIVDIADLELEVTRLKASLQEHAQEAAKWQADALDAERRGEQSAAQTAEAFRQQRTAEAQCARMEQLLQREAARVEEAREGAAMADRKLAHSASEEAVLARHASSEESRALEAELRLYREEHRAEREVRRMEEQSDRRVQFQELRASNAEWETREEAHCASEACARFAAAEERAASCREEARAWRRECQLERDERHVLHAECSEAQEEIYRLRRYIATTAHSSTTVLSPLTISPGPSILCPVASQEAVVHTHSIAPLPSVTRLKYSPLQQGMWSASSSPSCSAPILPGASSPQVTVSSYPFL